MPFQDTLKHTLRLNTNIRSFEYKISTSEIENKNSSNGNIKHSVSWGRPEDGIIQLLKSLKSCRADGTQENSTSLDQRLTQFPHNQLVQPQAPLRCPGPAQQAQGSTSLTSCEKPSSFLPNNHIHTRQHRLTAVPEGRNAARTISR